MSGDHRNSRPHFDDAGLSGWTLERKAERDDGVLVDIVREGGGWVENRDGKARV